MAGRDVWWIATCWDVNVLGNYYLTSFQSVCYY